MEIMVSIIVPVYNVELYVSKCLDSLVKQTYKNIEIIVINDGSTDTSGDICKKRAEKDHFVYISKRNEGLGATRNLGLTIAKGDYILFVDSDDWLALDAVEKMVSNIKKGESPDIIALSCYFQFDNNTGEIKEILQNEAIGTEPYAAVKRYVETRLNWSYGLYCKKETNVEQHMALFNKFAKLRNKYFKNKAAYWEYKFGLLGSFGSRWIIQFLGTNIQQLMYHIPFSSIIAQMRSGEKTKYTIYNKNEFRCKKIKDDIEGNLYSIIRNNGGEIDFFFIDFLEERYDMAELDDGNFITLSEAFSDSVIDGINIKRIIETGTEEHFKIWRKSCKKLVELLKEQFAYKQIILIKSRLATSYQMDKRFMEYPNREVLEEKNLMIERMEKYFLDLMDYKIQIYSYPEKIYTEEHFKMGIEPQYLGYSFYERMRMYIGACFDCIV